MTSEQYYLQDKRQYVGNDMLWWAIDANGYTTDLNKAHLYTKEEAIHKNKMRETDIPWPKSYIDNKWRPAVDMQYVDINLALDGTGIELSVAPKYVRPKHNCEGCGRFLTDEQMYCGCNNCGSAP